MRLVRFGPRGSEKPGALDRDGVIHDLSAVVRDIDGSTIGPEGLDRLRSVKLETLPVVRSDVRIGPCVGSIPNFICIGLNYADHAREAGDPIPTQPVLFSKHAGAVSGPNDPVVIPPGAEQVDWEVELAFVIGRQCWHVKQADALGYVAGYFVANDVSERQYQLEWQGQWIKGKSYYSFGPIGPWLVTADEVPDPQALDLWLDVNGKRRQTGNTRTMIFPVAELVSYLSRFFVLQPGDIVSTGTPPGVGLGQKPPVYLHAGDIIRLGIRGLGEQNQHVVAFNEDLRAAQER